MIERRPFGGELVREPGWILCIGAFLAFRELAISADIGQIPLKNRQKWRLTYSIYNSPIVANYVDKLQ